MKTRGGRTVAQASRLQRPASQRGTRPGGTPALLLAFYGDDFTGSADALEQLTLAGIRTVLFVESPTAKQLALFKNLRAVGVAGLTRSMPPQAMAKRLRPALKQLKALGARHVHYKVCSTFDSSPQTGSIGRAIEVATRVFNAPFVPLLVAAPLLGRYTVFGNHFARYGIGTDGEIHRLDRHPSISHHPVTPMDEADLRVHLGKQTRKRIALFDIQKLSRPWPQVRLAFKRVLAGQPDVILFDTLFPEQLAVIGRLMDGCASAERPLFSVGSSGVEMALTAHWNTSGAARRAVPAPQRVAPARQILVGSGSCSPVTSGQIAHALRAGFGEVALDPLQFGKAASSAAEIKRASELAAALLQSGRSVIVHTTRQGSHAGLARKLGRDTASVLGTGLGAVLRRAIELAGVPRLCIAGGDTSSYAARALGIQAVEMLAPLTPGSPLCVAHAPGSPTRHLEVVFKGGQVGPEDYFCLVRRGTQGN